MPRASLPRASAGWVRSLPVAVAVLAALGFLPFVWDVARELWMIGVVLAHTLTHVVAYVLAALDARRFAREGHRPVFLRTLGLTVVAGVATVLLIGFRLSATSGANGPIILIFSPVLVPVMSTVLTAVFLVGAWLAVRILTPPAPPTGP